ncbi:MAG: hypothetical protein IPG99_02715 [Ignavibacteria bacterium]|nr:hypothetical protein [Ignavibacteria bacterium]
MENYFRNIFGTRAKPYSGEFVERSFRTLSIYLRELLSLTSGELPKNFLITFPKIETAGQVDGLTAELSKLEKTLSLPEGCLHIEIMVETTKSLLNQQGQFALPLIAKAGNGESGQLTLAHLIIQPSLASLQSIRRCNISHAILHAT